MDYYVGMDLGGTNTKIGLLDKEGNIIFSIIVKTESYEGFENTVERLSNILKAQVKEANIDFEDVKGVGIGIPGPVVNNSVVKFFANFEWPNNLDISREFEKHLGKPVKADNDVNVITLGEMWRGGGKGYKNVLGIALGTGIGGGIVVDGKLISGKTGSAGEVGHIVVENNGKLCGCGHRGCWEAYASATGLVREANSRLTVNKNNLLYAIIDGKGMELEAKDIFDAAREGDQFSLDLVEYEAEYIAYGLGNLLNILDCDIVVIGGGIALAGDILFDRIEEKLKKYALSSTLENLKIVPAQLGNNAGIYGAAYLAQN